MLLEDTNPVEGDSYSHSLKFNSNGDLTIDNHTTNHANGYVKLDSNSKIPASLLPMTMEQVVKTLSSYTTNNIVTINDMTVGLVVAVINNNGRQVYPDIQYVNGRAVITADFEDGVVDTSWTIFKMNYITFLPDSSNSSSQS